MLLEFFNVTITPCSKDARLGFFLRCFCLKTSWRNLQG